VRLKLCIN